MCTCQFFMMCSHTPKDKEHISLLALKITVSTGNEFPPIISFIYNY